MSIDKRFGEYLALYGARAADWPEEKRIHLLRAQATEAGAAMIAEAAWLETLLRSTGDAPETDSDAINRILLSARSMPQPSRSNFMVQCRAALEYLVPHPAAAFASVLVLGLVLGLGTANLGTTLRLPTTHMDLDDTGAIL